MEYLVNILFEQILRKIEEESKIQGKTREKQREEGSVSNTGPKNSNGIEYTL